MPSPEDGCPFRTRLPALLLDELKDGERALVLSHVGACAACEEELAELRRLLAEIRSLPERAPDPDLAPRILAEVRKVAVPDHSRAGPVAKALAGLVAAAAVLALAAGSGPPRSAAAESDGGGTGVADVHLGVDWLLKTQEADGSWSVRRHGGGIPCDIGLTGLTLFALLESGREDRPVIRAIDRAASFLVRAQEADGRFGPPVTGSMYNHGPATAALLRLEAEHRWTPFSRVIDRALARIIAAQDPGGGWGYADPPRGRTNVVISFWPLRALDLGRAAHRQGLDDAIAVSRKWLDTLRDDSGRVGYSRPGEWVSGPATTTAIGAYGSMLGGRAEPAAVPGTPVRDLLGLYCLAAFSPAAAVDAIRHVRRNQVAEGPHRGSWPDMDEFGGAAGRVYNTSMGVLVASSSRD